MAKKEELLTVEQILSVEVVKDLLDEAKNNLTEIEALIIVSKDRKGSYHQHNAGFDSRAETIGALEWAKVMVIENG